MRTNKSSSIFNKGDLQGLTSQEKQFAEEQFHQIYAQQMSKLNMELTHKQKVLDNLNTLDEQEQKNLKEQYEKLKQKMAKIEQKRNKKLQEKTRQYKQNDEHWLEKLKEIKYKFRQQNRQAIQKAQQYRQESENYWKSKSKIVLQKSRTSMPSKAKSKLDISMSLYEDKSNQKSKKNIQSETLNQQSQAYLQNVALDVQIKLHQERSDYLKKKQQELIFQKALYKMEKINKKRQYIQKKHEGKPAEPTIPRSLEMRQHSIRKRRQFKKHSDVNPDNNTLREKNSLDKLIREHQQNKQRIQEQKFLYRGQIMENNLQRNRKQRIMKMVRKKVQELKVETLKKKESKNNLLS